MVLLVEGINSRLQEVVLLLHLTQIELSLLPFVDGFLQLKLLEMRLLLEVLELLGHLLDDVLHLLEFFR